MKTPWLTALLVALSLGPWALGQIAAPAGGAWVVTTTAASQYLFRGVRLGGPSLQPMAEYDRGNLALGIWSSFPLANKVPGQSDPEIDPYGSYKFPVNESVSVQPGFTVYTFPRAERRNGFYPGTFEPNLALNVTSGGITFTPKVYYDVVLDGPTYELNAAYAVPVRQIGSELDFYGSVGTYEWRSAIADATPHIKARGDYWSGTVSLPFQVSINAKVLASIGYVKGSNNTFKQATAPKYANPAAVGRVVVTLGYAVTF